MTTQVLNKSKIRKATMNHHDGTQRLVTVTDKETPFPKGHLLISHSDLSGNITYVNRWLIHLSGYKESELVGKPHYILRHPDMPAAVFKEMWTTIQAGHIWQGPLKNLRKDSGFFWADMTVTPSTRKGKPIGYVSVYHELDRSEIEEYEERYAEDVV
jgi:aerotaxis receptor